MQIRTRKILDKSFGVVAYASLGLMCLSLGAFLLPIIVKGMGACVFQATIEHDKFQKEILGRNTAGYEKLLEKSNAARAPLYEMMGEFENPKKAKDILQSLDKARSQSQSAMVFNYAAIQKILHLSAADKQSKMRKLGEEIFKPYTDLLLKLKETSLKSGTSFALQNILSEEKERCLESVKKFIESLNEKKAMTVAQKSFLRRNLSAICNDAIDGCASELESANSAYLALKKGIAELLGPANQIEKEKSNLMRQKYGQGRLDYARDILENSIHTLSIKTVDKDGVEIFKRVNAMEYFKGTNVEKIILYINGSFSAMLQPHWTFYAGFFFDNPVDSNIFGGIFPMVLGTFYLTFGAMIIAAPLGVVAAIYFSEYAKKNFLISILRVCVGTLAGVPSIVFGLFGLAFLINTLKISETKSVLAGSVTLALLILPTIMRSSEEALKNVPNSYREASLGLGASKWKCITSVLLPAALPGMLTGIIISMGRAAGETAPIIFTAATSTGAALAIWEVFTQPTPALSWSIYNICSEHELAEKVAHVQYGMVFTLVGIVLVLNLAAILVRAKMQKKLKT